ncbi:MAG: hypothetical protein K0U93_25915, partial [Gammaproteobacteria bacterium]|nr:hypothetical protein [Gammaproteobacteria bacterium]
PFKSTLLGSAYTQEHQCAALAVQGFSLLFSHDQRGRRLTSAERARFGWVGDDALVPHVWRMLTGPRIAMRIVFHPPVLASDFTDRKALTDALYRTVREPIVRLSE